MAFCNSCGANLTPGTRFCSKCGAAVLASAPFSSAASPAAAGPPGTVPVPVPPRSSDNSMKIVLIIVGAVVLIGVLGLAAVGFVGWRIARHTRVHQDGNNVKVETPFGVVESTKDPAEAVRNLGVDIYPGAQVTNNGAQVGNFGGVHTSSAIFETGDSFDKVAAFYKSKFPGATVSTSGANHCSIVSTAANNLVTINIQADGDKTKIQIARVSHDSDSSSSATDKTQ
jgi:zinc ribbon protein